MAVAMVVLMRRVIAMLAVLMMMVVRGVIAMLPLVIMVVLVRQKIRINVEFGIEVEAAQIKHFGDGDIAKMHRALRRARVHVLQAVLQSIQVGVTDQVGFGDEDLIGKAHLTPSLLAIVELLGRMLGIDQRQDGVQQEALGDLVVHEKGLRDRAWIGQACGFDHDPIKIQLALAFFGGQVLQGGA